MKKLMTISALTLAVSVGTATAEPIGEKDKWTGMAKFTAGALLGGLVGGPVGAVIGATGGGLSAEQGFRTTAMEADLTTARVRTRQLEEDIAMQEALIAELEQDAVARMELKIFFDTGVDQVGGLDQQRVEAVADYLVEHPEINIGLDGHADPRGTDEYNNVLSQERALAVKSLLLAHGIEDSRIRVTGHGSSHAKAVDSGARNYAVQRRVDIVLEVGGNALTQSNW